MRETVGSWNRIVSRFEENGDIVLSLDARWKRRKKKRKAFRAFIAYLARAARHGSLAVKSAARGPANADRHGTCAQKSVAAFCHFYSLRGPKIWPLAPRRETRLSEKTRKHDTTRHDRPGQGPRTRITRVSLSR